MEIPRNNVSGGSDRRSVSLTQIESTGHKRKGNRQACASCRQAKSRCDGTSDLTKPCSRCARLNQECERHSGFQRVQKKAKLDELTQQVQSLQAIVNANNAQVTTSNKGSPTGPIAAGHREQQVLDGARVPSLQAFPSIENLPTQVSHSLHLPGALPETNEQIGMSYQSTSLAESPYQSSIPYPTGAARQSVQELQSIEVFRDGSASDTFINNSRAGPLTPASELRLAASRSTITPYTRFQQAYVAAQPRSIGSVSLVSEQICQLFQTYFGNYHPYFSLLDPEVSPDDYYSRCPLLYWAIITIASHRCEDDPTLLGMLSQPVQNLLWSTIRKLPHSPFVVEALILFIMWPFPTSSMWTDPSFMLTSIAKSSAMQLGLHRPENIQDFSRVERLLNLEGIQDSVRIWAGCYIAAQCVASSIGQESILKPDQMITRAAEPNNVYQLPIGLHHYLRLTKFSVHVSKVLSENTETPSGLPDERNRAQIMDRLEMDFDQLKNELISNSTSLERVYISCTQLQLQIFYFFDGIQAQKRKEGLLKCYETASTMIQTMISAEVDLISVMYAPAQAYRTVLVAGIVLLRILNSSYSELVNFRIGKQNFNTAIRMLRQHSLQHNDISGRASKILSQLWIHYQNSPSIRESPPSLQLKSRLGGSLLHDALWTWRRECDDQKASRRGTRQNSPHKSTQQDWGGLPNTAQNGITSTDEMNSMLDFSGLENLDTSWLDGVNLLSWLLPGSDANQPISGPAFNAS